MSRYPFVSSMLVFLTLLPVPPVLAQADVAGLERGSLEQRHSALLKLLDIPPERRDAKLWTALAREALRALAASRGPKAPGEREEYTAYLEDLDDAIGESRDPAMIPVLLKFVGIGGPAIAGLDRFGNLAVPGLVQILNDGSADTLDKQGARFALAGMLDARGNTTLSDQNRRLIFDVAEQELHQRLTFGNVIDVAVLALATRRPDLRSELEGLTMDTEPWIRRGLVDRDQIKACQRIIQVYLQEHRLP
jgi:hypothetical protein